MTQNSLWAVAALVAALALNGCVKSVPVVEGASVWVYDAKGAPAAGLELVVEGADAPDDGKPVAAWKELKRLTTDAQGRARLPERKALRLALPVPHGSGPRGFVSRVRLGTAVLPTTDALAAQVLVDANRAVVAHLSFGSGALLFEDKDAASAACCSRVRRLGANAPLLAGAGTNALGPFARQSVVAAGSAEGLALIPEPALSAETEAAVGASLGISLQASAPSQPGAGRCTLDARLLDPQGAAIPDFRNVPSPKPQ